MAHNWVGVVRSGYSNKWHCTICHGDILRDTKPSPDLKIYYVVLAGDFRPKLMTCDEAVICSVNTE